LTNIGAVITLIVDGPNFRSQNLHDDVLSADVIYLFLCTWIY